MSRKKIKIFDSFSDLLTHYMRDRNKNQAYLVSKTGKDKRQISDYVNGNTKPYNTTIQEIADSLNVSIEETEEGKFKYFDPHSEDRPSVNELLEKYTTEKDIEGFSDAERDLLYEVLLDNAESLAINLRRLIEIEKNRSQD